MACRPTVMVQSQICGGFISDLPLPWGE